MKIIHLGRPSNKADVLALFDADLYPTATGNTRARIKNIHIAFTQSGAAEHSCLIYLDDNDKLIAACNWYEKINGTCTLYDIVVVPEYQGQGYGKKIYDEFYKILYTSGKTYLKFYSDLSSVGFYNKIGFKWLGFSKSEQIPWTICKIQSADSKKDCDAFFPTISYRDTVVMKEHLPIVNKTLNSVNLKRVLRILPEISPNFIEIQTTSLEDFFTETA